jgi:hypothetical protein
MKWNIAVAALFVSAAMCTQSFGFDLLDRMLGGSGCGCDTQCCETAADCCEADPGCGCEDTAPDCGCDAAPSCGCESDCNPCCRKPLIQINIPKIRLCVRDRCCEDAGCDEDPACGCDAAADCGCDAAPSCGCESACGGMRSLGLLDRIFSCKKRGCCDDGCEASCGVEPACGCSAGGAAPAASEASAPMPPAPVVDPSAFVAPQRSVAVR